MRISLSRPHYLFWPTLGDAPPPFGKRPLARQRSGRLSNGGVKLRMPAAKRARLHTTAAPARGARFPARPPRTHASEKKASDAHSSPAVAWTAPRAAEMRQRVARHAASSAREPISLPAERVPPAAIPKVKPVPIKRERGVMLPFRRLIPASQRHSTRLKQFLRQPPRIHAAATTA